MSTDAKEGMTAEAAGERLLEIASSARGPLRLVMPYETSRVTIGGTPYKPVYGFTRGFDWDTGKVFVDIGPRLRAPTPELENDRQLLRRAVDTIGAIALQMRDNRVSPDDKLKAIADTLALFNTRTSTMMVPSVVEPAVGIKSA